MNSEVTIDGLNNTESDWPEQLKDEGTDDYD
jgi:hypothetical protein